MSRLQIWKSNRLHSPYVASPRRKCKKWINITTKNQNGKEYYLQYLQNVWCYNINAKEWKPDVLVDVMMFDGEKCICAWHMDKAINILSYDIFRDVVWLHRKKAQRKEALFKEMFHHHVFLYYKFFRDEYTNLIKHGWRLENASK